MSLFKQQRDQVRSTILDVAYALFREKGYDNVSIEEITNLVGIAKGTLYNFFSSKRDILMELSLQQFKQLHASADSLASPDKSIEENLNNLVEILCVLIKQEYALFFYFIRDFHQPTKEPEADNGFDFATLLSMVVSNSKDFSYIGKNYFDYKVKVINSALFYEILDWRYRGKPMDDLETHLKRIIEVCLYGVYSLR